MAAAAGMRRRSGPFYGYEWMKAHCGALPDGRLRGQSLSRGLNPSERTPAELSAILHTMDGVDYAQFPQSAVAYFCMPVSLADDNVQICASLIRCFLACGGSAVDFDVLDSAAIAGRAGASGAPSAACHPRLPATVRVLSI